MIKILIKVVCLLIAIAYYTIAERKIMAAIQRRRGPNVVGFWGLLQPLADGLKLIAKELVIPSHANSRIFVLAPLAVLMLSLLSWSVLPFQSVEDNLFYPADAFIPAFITVVVIAILMWAHYGKYALKPARGLPMYYGAWLSPELLGLGQYAVGLAVIFFIGKLLLELCPETKEVPKPPSAEEMIANYNKMLPAEKAFFTEHVLKTQTDYVYFTHALIVLVMLLLAVLIFVSYKHMTLRASDVQKIFFLLEGSDIADTRYGILVILAISGLSVYWISLAGWASNSKYAFLGSLRSAAQMIAYEVAVSLTLLPVVAMAGSANLTEIVLAQRATVWFVFPLLPMALVFFISMVAETNRTPFDLPEAEAELVAGYNVEYSSITFAMFFLAEYGNMILASLLFVILFLAGWVFLSLGLKGLVFCFLFVLIRATLPRYRYDQLMAIGWKVFLPLATAYFVFIEGMLYAFNAAPC